jgi:hypothetical protein
MIVHTSLELFAGKAAHSPLEEMHDYLYDAEIGDRALETQSLAVVEETPLPQALPVMVRMDENKWYRTHKHPSYGHCRWEANTQ